MGQALGNLVHDCIFVAGAVSTSLMLGDEFCKQMQPNYYVDDGYQWRYIKAIVTMGWAGLAVGSLLRYFTNK